MPGWVVCVLSCFRVLCIFQAAILYLLWFAKVSSQSTTLPLSFEIPYLCVCLLLTVCRTCVGVRRQAVGLALSFPHVGPWYQTRGIKLGSKFLHLLNHLSGPLNSLNPWALACSSYPKSPRSGRALQTLCVRPIHPSRGFEHPWPQSLDEKWISAFGAGCLIGRYHNRVRA